MENMHTDVRVLRGYRQEVDSSVVRTLSPHPSGLLLNHRPGVRSRSSLLSSSSLLQEFFSRNFPAEIPPPQKQTFQITILAL